MAITGTNRGVGIATKSGSGFSFSPVSNFTAGKKAVICIGYDNAGTNGADPFTSISDSHGNTYSLLQERLLDQAGVNAGIVGRMYETDQDVGNITTSTVITVATSVTFVGRAATYVLHELSGSVGAIQYVTGASDGLNTTGDMTITTSSIPSGDAVIGFWTAEIDDTLTPDSDSSNGSWSTHQTILDDSAGTNNSAIRTSSQRKIVTGTATQTYNIADLGGSTSDSKIIMWVQFTEVTYTPVDPFGQNGFFGI